MARTGLTARPCGARGRIFQWKSKRSPGELSRGSNHFPPSCASRRGRRLRQKTRRRGRPNQEVTMSTIRLTRCVRGLSLAGLIVLTLAATNQSSAQDFKGKAKAKLPDFIPAGYDDYQNMLDQL